MSDRKHIELERKTEVGLVKAEDYKLIAMDGPNKGLYFAKIPKDKYTLIPKGIKAIMEFEEGIEKQSRIVLCEGNDITLWGEVYNFKINGRKRSYDLDLNVDMYHVEFDGYKTLYLSTLSKEYKNDLRKKHYNFPHKKF